MRLSSLPAPLRNGRDQLPQKLRRDPYPNHVEIIVRRRRPHIIDADAAPKPLTIDQLKEKIYKLRSGRISLNSYGQARVFTLFLAVIERSEDRHFRDLGELETVEQIEVLLNEFEHSPHADINSVWDQIPEQLWPRSAKLSVQLLDRFIQLSHLRPQVRDEVQRSKRAIERRLQGLTFPMTRESPSLKEAVDKNAFFTMFGELCKEF